MTTDAVKWTADEERNARDWFQKLRRYLGSLEYDPASSQLRQTQHLASKYGTLLEHALDAERAAREQVEQKLAKISVATDFYSENDVRLSWAGGEVCMNCSHKLCQRVRNAEKAREQFAANADMLMEQGEAIARERDRLAARVTVLEQAHV